jgi:sigma-B regulation protein RsbQ
MPVQATTHPSAATGVVRRNNVSVAGTAQGRPLVFVHGFGCDQRVWRWVAPAFAGEHPTVLFDHVGAGGSDLAAYDRVRYDDLAGYADDLAEICEELDLRDAVLVGHSVGATISVLAAARVPGRVSGLVLVAPSPRFLDDPADGYTGGFARADVDGLLETMNDNYLGWSAAVAGIIMGNPDRPELAQELGDSFCRTDPTIAEHFARVTFLADHRRDLAGVDIPTLVLQCSDDALAPEAVGRYVHAQVRGSRLALLRATGHCPHMSAPDETVGAIREFLSTR